MSLLIVTALWVSNRGVQQVLAGGPDAMSAIGRLTGLLASDLLLLQVLLMARVPLVERAFGQDRLARWHRWTGFTSFHLMVAHIVFITIGYAGSAHANAFAELWDMIVSYPGMLLATAGTALLVMAVVTSMRAGQFFQWRFLDGPGWSRSHPYSLSATPGGDLLRITVKDLGDGSARVASLQPGTKTLIEGPYGKLTGEAYPGGPVLMLACGIGITPLLALLGELPYRPGEATLLYRARSEAELAFRSELDWLARNRGVRIRYLLGPRAAQPSWLPRAYAGHDDVAALRQLAPQVAASQVDVCGPDAWTETAHAAAVSAGVPAENLHTEQFAW